MSIADPSASVLVFRTSLHTSVCTVRIHPYVRSLTSHLVSLDSVHALHRCAYRPRLHQTQLCWACMPALPVTVCLCGGTNGMFVVVAACGPRALGRAGPWQFQTSPRPDLAGGPTSASCRTNRTVARRPAGITRRSSSNDWSPAGTAGVLNILYILCSYGFPGPSRTAGLPAPLLFVPGRKPLPCCVSSKALPLSLWCLWDSFSQAKEWLADVGCLPEHSARQGSTFEFMESMG